MGSKSRTLAITVSHFRSRTNRKINAIVDPGFSHPPAKAKAMWTGKGGACACLGGESEDGGF